MQHEGERAAIVAVRCLTSSLEEGGFTTDTGIHGKYFRVPLVGWVIGFVIASCQVLEVLLLWRVFCLDECDISDLAMDNAEYTVRGKIERTR
jgi:hypothetical protein